MEYREIIEKISRHILVMLSDRNSVTIESLGTFSPIFHQEYLLFNETGGKTLMPPRVTLLFTPSIYILSAEHYTELTYTPPQHYIAPELVSTLADMVSVEESELVEAVRLYLDELFKALFRGKRVNILGFGDGYVADEAAGTLFFNFVVDENVTKSLNRPFEPYAPIAVTGGVGEGLEQIRGSVENITQIDLQPQKTPLKLVEPTPLQPDTLLEKEIIIPSEKPSDELSNEEETMPLVVTPDQEEGDLPEEPILAHIPEEERKKGRTWPYIIVILSALIAIGGGFWLFSGGGNAPRHEPKVAKVAPKDGIPPVDTIKVQEKIVATPVVLDTITFTPGTTLSRLAREYYGIRTYWVYIYMANDSLLHDPDHVPVGVELIVPALDRFVLDSDSITALQEAKVWESIIMNRHYKNYEAQRPEVQARLHQQ